MKQGTQSTTQVYLLHQETYNHGFGVLILDYSQCHNGCKFLRIGIDKLVDLRIYLHVVWYLYLHEILMIDQCCGGHQLPVIELIRVTL